MGQSGLCFIINRSNGFKIMAKNENLANGLKATESVALMPKTSLIIIFEHFLSLLEKYYFVVIFNTLIDY